MSTDDAVKARVTGGECASCTCTTYGALEALCFVHSSFGLRSPHGALPLSRAQVINNKAEQIYMSSDTSELVESNTIEGSLHDFYGSNNTVSGNTAAGLYLYKELDLTMEDNVAASDLEADYSQNTTASQNTIKSLLLDNVDNSILIGFADTTLDLAYTDTSDLTLPYSPPPTPPSPPPPPPPPQPLACPADTFSVSGLDEDGTGAGCAACLDGAVTLGDDRTTCVQPCPANTFSASGYDTDAQGAGCDACPAGAIAEGLTAAQHTACLQV